MERFDLPEGWEWRTIKEVCHHPQYGYTESANDAPIGPKFLRITDIQDGYVDWSRVPYCNCQEAGKYRLQTGDVVFARTGGTTGKSYFITSPPDAVFASYLIRLRAKEKLSPRYLYWFFQSPYYWQAIQGGVEDGNRPNFNGAKLADLELPVPELSVQRQLVDRIEKHTNRIDTCRRAQKELEAELRGVLAGYYAEITADAEWKPLGEVAPQVRRPVTVQAGQGYPELGIRSFGKGTFHKPAISAEQLGSKRLYHIHPGDLIFNNVFAWEGAVAVVKQEDAGRVGSHRFITCVPKPKVATSPFLYFHFTTEQGLHDLGDASPGGAGRNRTLGLTKLAAIKVPMPDYDKQVVFARLWEKAQEMRRLQDDLTADLTAYVPALLAKAFRGEL